MNRKILLGANHEQKNTALLQPCLPKGCITQKQQNTKNAIWIVEKWCVVKDTNFTHAAQSDDDNNGYDCCV
jgi:hypothetical protein